MGCCLSSQSPANSPALAGARATDPAAAAAASSSRARIRSKSWKQRKKQKKRGGGGGGIFERRSAAGGNPGEEELHRIPGRMFLNGASDVACLFTQQGRKGTNQDAMIVWENYTMGSDTIFCGVFDGHGPFGHMVAKKVRDSLPLKLSAQQRVNGGNNVSSANSPRQNGSAHGSTNSEETASISIDDEWAESIDVDESEKLPEMHLALKQSFLKAFKLMDKELKLHPTIDCFCSGTTAVTVVKQEMLEIREQYLGTRDKDNSLIAVQLTVDLKPNLPREAARIQQCKGRVFALQDEPEVARVWLPNNDSPGLAMARAFGDFCLKDYGLISVPDISYRHLTDKDEFIVLATDGIWDVLSNKEVVDIVASAPTRSTAARALVDCAVRAWRLKFPTSKSDDCAVVCLFFDRQPSDPPEENMTTNKEHTDPGVAAPPTDQELDHPYRDADEIEAVSDEPKLGQIPDRCQSARSLADCISTAEEEEWSALEGVTRVNSLLNLPRFLSVDKRSTSWRKWL